MLLCSNHSADGYLQIFDIGVVICDVLVKARMQSFEQAGVVFDRVDKETTNSAVASEVVT